MNKFDDFKEEKKPFEYYVKEFNEGFKWEKVHKAMLALNWCWFFGHDEFGNDNMGVPNINTLKNHAYKYLKDAYDTGKQTGSGGFNAGWEGEEMFLTFSLEEWSV